ncbi:MAG: aldehyde dehydrogenase family protein [Verrucomicrobia subdivision 3 bacterium]|nr:aldehyde dehydrogenase family protein [Limisphaerales bacterium]
MNALLKRLGLRPENPGVFGGEWIGSGPVVERVSPIDGQSIALVREATAKDYEMAVARAAKAFVNWRLTPAPVRGETVRQLGNALRDVKSHLARLVAIETGKIIVEAEGEVQEMIDICDFAVGLSRQLYGLTIASERRGHRLMEQWHPLGAVGVITAFNFPVAVWSWNAALASVCGDSVVWKPSEKTALCAIAVTRIAERVCRATGADPAIFSLIVGDGKTVGRRMAEDRRLPLISATGSCAMGRAVAQAVARRTGRTLLELGGNNAVIVTPSADLDLAARGIFFGAVGTAGQRCTTTRRVIVHRSVEKALRERLVGAYRSLRIGNPLDRSNLMGPLINHDAVVSVGKAMRQLERQGGKVIYGGEPLGGPEYPGGCYMIPCIATARSDVSIVKEETFGPLLYLIPYDDLEEAITMQNDVPQGLSSGIFTNDLREAERFVSVSGSDCGIANINAGTSGAEIGGAFGGEKDTGGGRESGSDAWKNYMRRQTNTVNFSGDLPLAQGIQFGE